jgi:hypothetical protein
MNILIDLLPKKVEIKSIEYEINSDFRTSMLFEMLMQDIELTEEEKIINALKLYYPIIPNDIDIAVEKILWFYRCGKDIKESKEVGKGKSVQIYDYNFDDEYIYSAFLDQYNVDLQDIEYLHWWKFKAMFKSLKEDNEIVKIMGYRSMDLNKIKDEEQKDYYTNMQELYKLPVTKSKAEEQKINDIEKALMGNGDLKKIL